MPWNCFIQQEKTWQQPKIPFISGLIKRKPFSSVWLFLSQRCQFRKILCLQLPSQVSGSFFHVGALNFYEVKNWNSSNKNRIDICCPCLIPKSRMGFCCCTRKSKWALLSFFLSFSARPRTRFHTRFDTLLI